MTSKKQRAEYAVRRELQDFGIKVEKTDKIEFNSGSETIEHLVAKALTAKILKDRGYRVDSEVIIERGENEYELDILGYGWDDMIVGVECETNLTQETQTKKLERYLEGTPLSELYFVPVDQLPNSVYEIKAAIKGYL